MVQISMAHQIRNEAKMFGTLADGREINQKCIEKIHMQNASHKVHRQKSSANLLEAIYFRISHNSFDSLSFFILLLLYDVVNGSF